MTPARAPAGSEGGAMPCGVPFLDCLEPSDTVYQGIVCRKCGTVMSAEEHERQLQAELEDAAHG